MRLEPDTGAVTDSSARATPAGRSRADTVMWWLAIVGFPLSLVSPGATVSMALVAIYGVVVLARYGGIDEDLRRVHRYMTLCYCLVLGADLLNGGGMSNLYSTGVNYLPLLALAPYAHALRKLGISAVTIERAVQVTLFLAFANSVVRAVVFGEYRPGGPNLASIGFGIVVATWVVFLLSCSLERARETKWSFVAISLGTIPVFLTASKIVIACFLVGCTLVAFLWAKERRRWKVMLFGVVVVSIPIMLGMNLALRHRLLSFWEEIIQFWNYGTTSSASFGERYELTVSGLRAFLEKPLLGHGLVGRLEEVRRYSTPDGPDISKLTYLHNDYVTHLVAYGMVGAIFLAAYFVFVWLVLRKSEDGGYRHLSIALPSMLALYMVADVVFNMDPVTGLLTILLGAVLATDGQRRSSGQGTDA